METFVTKEELSKMADKSARQELREDYLPKLCETLKDLACHGIRHHTITVQDLPDYEDVVDDIVAFLKSYGFDPYVEGYYEGSDEEMNHIYLNW